MKIAVTYYSCDGRGCGNIESEECCGGGCGTDGSEENSCGCGGGCGGCGGGCHQEPLFEGKNVGKTLRAHYTGTFDDGSKFDSSYDRGEPLEFMCGYGYMIEGFDKAVANMEVGDIVDVHLTPDQAYGDANPNMIITMEIAELPGAEQLTVGQRVYLQDMYGRPFPVKVTAMDDTNITFDGNHELAGKALNFKIELVEIVA